MIEYRPFRNDDPPGIVRLWNAAGLGRGAAGQLTPDGLDFVIFSQAYFDPDGLIVAVDRERTIGFALAGFAARDDESGLDTTRGVICAVVVDPDRRRQGIGRELVRRAEEYLTAAGATSITAGPGPGSDPYLMGIYGGSQPAGFLDSDPAAAPFFTKLGYAPAERHAVFQRQIPGPSAPVNVRLVNLRRKTEVVAVHQPSPMSWWWATRFGRLDSLQFQLTSKGSASAPALAAVTLAGLDFYLATWSQRAVGLADVFVPEAQRRKGHAQTLILEICRRLESELITCMEVHAPESNTAGVGLLESCGFTRIDTGTVFRKQGIGNRE